MIEIETFKALEQLRGTESVVRVAGMQAILMTKKMRVKHITVSGSFAQECMDQFADLLGESPESAAIAMSEMMGCTEYDQRQSLQGLGGCVAYSLEECISTAMKTYQEAVSQLPQRLRQRG